MEFCGEIFRGLIARTVYCPPSLQTTTETTFAGGPKTAKFAKVFSLEIFPLYGIQEMSKELTRECAKRP